MPLPWGSAGAALRFTGASGKEWDLTLASPLGGAASSAVWLARDGGGASLAAKRARASTDRPVEALVDDAALWRAACLGAPGSIVELLDVYVDRRDGEVVYLMEYCGVGHVPRGGKVGDAGVLNLTVGLCEAIEAVERAGDGGSVGMHGNINGESVVLDGDGRVKLAGFGGERMRDVGGEGGDMWDVGAFLYSVCFKGVASAEGGWAGFPESRYGEAVLGVLWELLAPGDDPEMDYAEAGRVKSMALAAGGRPGGVVFAGKKIGGGKVGGGVVSGGGGGVGGGSGGGGGGGGGGRPFSEEAVERAVDKLVDGVDVAGAYSVVLGAVKGSGEEGADAVFAALFRCPVSRDPIVAFRAMGMLHNLMMDGGEVMLDCVRRNERFMEWAETSWTAEAAERMSRPGGADGEDGHASCFCFSGGEIAYYSSLLRRKARFHMLSAGAFSGSWERTGAVNESGRDVIATRRKKVVGGIADLVEMGSELGVLLAGSTDVEAAVKHAGLRTLMDECGRAHEAVLELAEECTSVESVEKLVPGYDRIWRAAKALVVSVRAVPAAGGSDWEESLAGDGPREIAAEAELRLADEVLPDMSEVVIDSAFDEETKEEKAARKAAEKERRREEKREAKRAEKERKIAEEAAAKEALTAADGAVVLHGQDDSAGKVKTMFGDLLGVGDSKPVQRRPTDPRPKAGLSDAAALAAAFGASPDAVSGGDYLALPAPGMSGEGEDGSDDGGYETYQARQEEEVGNQERARNERSTGAWAARAGYGGMALVVAGATGTGPAVVPGKKHPVFCQCAECQDAEDQLAASVAAARVNDGYSDDGRDHSTGEYLPRDDYGGAGGDGGGGFGDNRAANPYDDDGDDGAYGAYGSGGGGSYQSVDYSVDGELGGAAARSGNYDSLSDDGGRQAPPVFAMPPPGANADVPGPSSGDYRAAPQPAVAAKPRTPAANAPVLPPSKVINMKRLRLGDKIGEGAFGIVYAGEYQREKVAIKKMHKALSKNTAALAEFAQEVSTMCQLDHPNVLSCIAAGLSPPEVVLVSPFMKRGTLFDVMYRERIRLTTALVRKMALQIAEGLAYLHEKGILHRDLKSSNVLVDGSYNVKLGDFGLARDQDGANAAAAGGLSGTIQYLSPECLRGEPHSPKSDVYAYGLVIWEMVSGEPPYVGVDAMVAARQVLDEGLRPVIPQSCPRAFVSIIQACWANSPAARPSFAHVVQLIKTTTK